MVVALVFVFAPSAGAAACEGDECQGPPPAPEEIVPGTAVVEGPPNPPVRFPHETGHRKNKKPVKKNKHRKHHRGHGR